MIIKGNSLDSGVWHRTTVCACTPGSIQSCAELEFLINKAPYGGKCTVKPGEGNVLCFIVFLRNRWEDHKNQMLSGLGGVQLKVHAVRMHWCT